MNWTLLDQAQQAPLSEPDCHKITTTLRTLVEMLVAKRSTEKTSAVVGTAGGDAAAEEPAASTKEQANGHGRIPGVGLYRGHCAASESQAWRCVPGVPQGEGVRAKGARPLVRIVGQAPLAATVYALEQLRCNACGQLFTAPEP